MKIGQGLPEIGGVRAEPVATDVKTPHPSPATAVPAGPSPATPGVTAEGAESLAGRSGAPGSYTGAALLREAHQSESRSQPELALAALVDWSRRNHGVPAFDGVPMQPLIDAVLSSISDPAALFPRDGKLEKAPDGLGGGDLAERFGAGANGRHKYFELLVLLSYGSDLTKTTIIADKLLDELPKVRWSNHNYSPFAAYYDPVIRDDVGGRMYGVAERRVLPALISMAMRLGQDAPFSRKLAVHLESDAASRADLVDYFARGLEATPPLVRNFASRLTLRAARSERPSAAELVFDQFVHGRKPNPEELIARLTTMHPSEILYAIPVMEKELGLPCNRALVEAVAPSLLATHSFTDSGYGTRIAGLLALAERAGAREQLLRTVDTARDIPGLDATSAHAAVIRLCLVNAAGALTLGDVDRVVSAYVHGSAMRRRPDTSEVKRAAIDDPLTHLATEIANGSRMSQDQQPALVLARGIQAVLTRAGYSGVEGFARYLANRHRDFTRRTTPDHELPWLLVVTGQPGCWCYDRNFSSLSEVRPNFWAAHHEAVSARLRHESSWTFRLGALLQRLGGFMGVRPRPAES